jgi:hypothetical protein
LRSTPYIVSRQIGKDRHAAIEVADIDSLMQLVEALERQPQGIKRRTCGISKRSTRAPIRKQTAKPTLLVEQSLGHNVFEPALHVFTKRRDRVHFLYWQRNGSGL